MAVPRKPPTAHVAPVAPIVEPAAEKRFTGNGVYPEKPYSGGPGEKNHVPQIAAPMKWIGTEAFLAAYCAEMIPHHWVRLCLRKCRELYGIEAVREIATFMASNNRRVAPICRAALAQMEALQRDLDRRTNPGAEAAG